MNDISPTRSELLETKHKLALAKKGHSLLKKKQDVLVLEFFKRVKEYKQFRKDLTTQIKSAYESLAIDIAYSGIFVSKSVSYAMPQQFEIVHDQINIMGLSLPKISAKKLHKEVSGVFENTPQLAHATRNFHDLFQNLIVLSSMKIAITTLADEIKKIKRRVNSLEHIQIPKLQDTMHYISFVLAEQERESFTQLKTVKERLEHES